MIIIQKPTLNEALILAVCLLLSTDANAIETFPQTYSKENTEIQPNSDRSNQSRKFRKDIASQLNAAELLLQLTSRDIARINTYNNQLHPGEPYQIGLVKPLGIHVDFQSIVENNQEVLTKNNRSRILNKDASAGLVWAMRLDTSNASGVRLVFRDVHLPQGVRLSIYNDSGDVIGPYEGDHEELWAHQIDGSSLYLQLNHQLSDDESIKGVHFRVDEALLFAPSMQSFCPENAPCIEDGTCFGQVDWPGIEDARKGVAMITFVDGQGGYLCSGGLLNDLDETSVVPYFLTANHCVSTSRVANSVETYFNFKTPSCGSRCFFPENSSTVGATLLHTSKADDHTLLRLSENPPNGAVFLGWTDDPVAWSSGKSLYRLSHPKGAPQAFSKHQVDSISSVCDGAPRGPYIYSRDTIGATEVGSSGSLLMTENAQVVGQLLGACGLPWGDVCDTNNQTTVDGAFANYYPDIAEWLGAEKTANQPRPQSPTGRISDESPDFSWIGYPAASHYYLYISNTKGKVFGSWFTLSQANCLSDVNCTIKLPQSLQNDKYYWWVIGWGNGEFSEWSDRQDFILEAPNPGMSSEVTKLEEFKGSWTFSYTIQSLFTQVYDMSGPLKLVNKPSYNYLLYGYDQYRDSVGAVWRVANDLYMLSDPATAFDRIFVFEFTASDKVSGCYYQYYGGTLGNCYAMTGIRTDVKTQSTRVPNDLESRLRVQLREANEAELLTQINDKQGSDMSAFKLPYDSLILEVTQESLRLLDQQ